MYHECPQDINILDIRMLGGSTMNLFRYWFESNDHQENFAKLMKYFNAYNQPEYESACYIVSLPEIYKLIDWSNVENPIAWYFEDGEDGTFVESEIVAQLSSAYQGLVRACVELFTGRKHNFDLISWLNNADNTVYKCFVQALDIRRNRFMFNF